MSGFTTEQLDVMVRDADRLAKSCMATDLAADVCTSVKAAGVRY